MILQAWFDESGKTEEPVYIVAGYVGSKQLWQDFADDWQKELKRSPELPYLHANEAQIFKGLSPAERLARTLRFVEVIKRHRPTGITFGLRHEDYRKYYQVLLRHPFMRKASERRLFKNPYFIAFEFILNITLLRHAKTSQETGTEEMIEILFDEGMDRKTRLKLGFQYFIDTTKRRTPEFLPLLVNKEPEFRDDKVFLPLQAADLLAWHLRRRYYDDARRIKDENPVWRELRNGIEYQDFSYTEKQWLDLLDRMYSRTIYVMQHGKL